MSLGQLDINLKIVCRFMVGPLPLSHFPASNVPIVLDIKYPKLTMIVCKVRV